MTDHDTARKEIRLRQREICFGVGLANGEAGGDYTYSLFECNEALQREGLPAMADEAEWDLVMNGPQPTDPVERELKRLTEIELTSIAHAAKQTISMHGSMGLTVEDTLAAAGTTLDDAIALATKRARDKLGMRQN